MVLSDEPHVPHIRSLIWILPIEIIVSLIIGYSHWLYINILITPLPKSVVARIFTSRFVLHIVDHTEFYVKLWVLIFFLLVFIDEVGLGFVAISLRFAGVPAILGDFVAYSNASYTYWGIEEATNSYTPTGWLCKVSLVLCGLVQVGILCVVILVCRVWLCWLVLGLL